MSATHTQKKLTPQQKIDFACHNIDGGQARISCPPLVVNAAIDTYHLTLDLDIKSPELLEALEERKKEIQSSTFALSGLFDFGSDLSTLFSWSLSRTGIKNYPYSLSTGDITLNLSNRQVGSQIPNASLQVGSLSSQTDPLEIYANICRWLKLFKIKVLSNKVSRIDPCCDYAQNIEELNIADQRFQICRATSFECYAEHRRITGMSVGSGRTIMLRVYNKVGEMKKKKASEKQRFFQQKWDSKGFGDVVEVTRFEFQIRRAALRQFFPEESSLRTVVDGMGYLWRYLTTSWFRHTEQVVDRKNKNHKQSQISEMWKQIESAWGEYSAIVRQRGQKHVSVPDLVSQVAGICKTIGAAFGLDWADLPQLLDTSMGLITERFKIMMLDPTYRDDFKNRACRAVVSF